MKIEWNRQNTNLESHAFFLPRPVGHNAAQDLGDLWHSEC